MKGLENALIIHIITVLVLSLTVLWFKCLHVWLMVCISMRLVILELVLWLSENWLHFKRIGY